MASRGIVGSRSKLLNALVAIGVVINDALANERNVEQSVEEIWAPVVCWSAAGDCEAASANGDVRQAYLVRARTDDGF